MKSVFCLKSLVLSASVLALAGCASVTPTREVSEGYAIFDVKGDITHAKAAEALKVALQKTMSGVQITNGLPPSPLPEKAGRFALSSPLKGVNNGLAALMAASGQALQVATCEGAIVTANAGNTSMSQYGEATSFFVCLMPYQGGYGLNVYTRFSKSSGGFSAATLGATLARSVTGDSSQFIPRTINTLVESLKAAGATVTLVEAYP